MINIYKEILFLGLFCTFFLLLYNTAIAQKKLPVINNDSISDKIFSDIRVKKNTPSLDSNLSKLKDIAKVDKSLNQLWKKNSTRQVSGSLGFLTEYGNLNTLNTSNPSFNTTLIGDVNIVLLGIPIKLNTKYSPYSRDNFTRNFFKLGFDKSKFSSLAGKQKNFKSEMIQNKIEETSSKMGESYRQRAYFDLLDNKEYFPSLPVSQSFEQFNSPQISDFNTTDLYMDSIQNFTKTRLTDDYSTPQNWKDTLQENGYKDNLESTGKKMIMATDSLNYQRNKCEQTYDQLQNELHFLMDYKTILDSGMAIGNKYTSFLKNFQAGLKKFDLGLITPNFSTFLISQTVIKGVNFEWENEKKGYYFAHGKTQELIQPDFDSKRNNVVKSFFNQLDPSDLETGRRVTAAKLILFKNKSTTIKTGGLYGEGKDSYWHSDVPLLENNNIEKNIVFELEAEQKIGKISTFKMVYAKSKVDNNVNISENSINNKPDVRKGNAAFASIANRFSKTKTTFDISARLTDQNFRSFGARFVRPGQLRFDSKLTQQITKRIKIGFNARKENTEFANDYASSNNSLNSVGANVGIKIFKAVHADFNIQNIESEVALEGENLQTIGSRMVSGNLVWFRHNKEVLQDANLNYNRIQFNTPTNINYLTTITGLFNVRNGEKWNQKFDALYLQDVLPDSSISIKSIVFGTLFESSISKNITFGLGAKAGSSNNKPVWGATGTIGCKAGKHLLIDASAQKRVVDTYYSTKYFNESILYPYYYSIQISWLWQ